MKKSKIMGAIAGAALAVGLLAGCTSPADTVSRNLSQDAEDFKVIRKIVFINGITDKYLLTIEGRCSVETSEGMLAGALEVTCKIGDDEYTKDFLGLSDNVTFLVHQVDPTTVDKYHYKVFFRPETLIPDIELQTSGGE